MAPTRWILPLLFLGLAPHGHAASKNRVGFQNMTAHRGGYQITVPDSTTGNLAGPATVRVRPSRDGRSARVTWTNTFYNSRGRQRLALQWHFRPDGSVRINTLDPRRRGLPGAGAFVVRGRSPVTFTASDGSGLVRVSGRLRLIGGGTLSIEVTLTGLPEGDVSYSFTGSRAR